MPAAEGLPGPPDALGMGPAFNQGPWVSLGGSGGPGGPPDRSRQDCPSASPLTSEREPGVGPAAPSGLKNTAGGPRPGGRRNFHCAGAYRGGASVTLAWLRRAADQGGGSAVPDARGHHGLASELVPVFLYLDGGADGF